MAIDLSGARAKLDRAKEHRDSLEAIIDPVLEGKANQIQLRAERDSKTSVYSFRVAATPDEWRLRVGILIGDVIHNLRSALDHLFWQLYLRYIGMPKPGWETQRVPFPIEDRSERLRKKRETFRKIPSSHWAIIEGAQPYKRRNRKRVLAILRNLSNRDKHQVLTPILVQTTMFSLTGEPFEGTGAKKFFFARPRRNLKVRTKVVRVEGLPDRGRKVEMAGYVTPRVLLPERRDAFLTTGISEMIACVEGVINDIGGLL
jgi:hypothetical protein